MKNYQITKEQLIKDMQECQQTPGQSVYEHGLSVRNYLFDLLEHLETGSPLKYTWKIPAWVYENKEFILSKMCDVFTLEEYTRFHDCGKPYCKTIDTEGKVHFPDHAEVSYEVYKSVFKSMFANVVDDVAELIRMDMDIHTMKSEQLSVFAKSPYAVTLIMTGLAEIHSNAAMFGGIDSVSFKIKWKQIDKRGRQVLEMIK